jgi:hypothetical protein
VRGRLTVISVPTRRGPRLAAEPPSRRPPPGVSSPPRPRVEVAGELVLVAVARHHHDDAPLVDVFEVHGGAGPKVAGEDLGGLDHHLLPDPRLGDPVVRVRGTGPLPVHHGVLLRSLCFRTCRIPSPKAPLLAARLPAERGQADFRVPRTAEVRRTTLKAKFTGGHSRGDDLSPRRPLAYDFSGAVPAGGAGCRRRRDSARGAGLAYQDLVPRGLTTPGKRPPPVGLRGLRATRAWRW